MTKALRDMSEREFLGHLVEMASGIARERGEPVDTVRKKIAFQLLLQRLTQCAPGEYTLKGGYAIEIKFGVVRSTKDIDLVTRSLMRAAFSQNYEQAATTLRQRLVDHLAESQGEEDRHVRFRVADSYSIVKGGGGGVGLTVRMIIGTQRFTEFSIDLSLEDIKSPARETVPLTPIVGGFPGPPEIDVLADEQIFAEKLHAYMRHGEGFQARAKDLVDLVLIARRGIDHETTRRLIAEVFHYWREEGAGRGLKSLPDAPASSSEFSPPPSSWEETYARMAREMGIEGNMADGYRLVLALVREILGD